MDFKKIIFCALSVLCLCACSQRYQLRIPLALNREEMRFKNTGASYYVMVYCENSWTASIDADASWVKLSTLEGSGNSQLTVTVGANQGTSQGTMLTINSGNLSKQMYISQEGSIEGSYGVQQSVDVTAEAGINKVPAATNLSGVTLSHVQDTVSYASEGEKWIKDIQIAADEVSFSVDANTTGVSRSATVKLTFPLARWDTPVTSVFTVNQSNAL